LYVQFPSCGKINLFVTGCNFCVSPETSKICAYGLKVIKFIHYDHSTVLSIHVSYSAYQEIAYLVEPEVSLKCYSMPLDSKAPKWIYISHSVSSTHFNIILPYAVNITVRVSTEEYGQLLQQIKWKMYYFK
jgi:hypothetical protein